MIREISFCIVDSGYPPEVVGRCIESIHRQSVPEYEVMCCGGGSYGDGIQAVAVPGSVDNRDFNAVAGLFSKKASNEFLLLIDANIELAPDWYDKVKNADCFDIVASRISTPDSSRAIDWGFLLSLGDRIIPSPLHYDEWTTKAFVSGSLMLVRRKLFETVEAGCGEGHGDGDVEFCVAAAHMGFRVGVFKEATATYHPVPGVDSRMEHYTFNEYAVEIESYRTAYSEGVASSKNGKYEEAVKHFTTALNIAPNAPDPQGGLGWALYFNGSYDSAVKEFDKAITRNPENNYLLRGRGWCYLQVNRHDRAYEDFSVAVKLIKQGDVDALMETWRGLCWSCYHGGRLKEAIENFESFLSRVEPEHVGVLRDIYSGLGWSYYNSGLYEEALENFESLIALIDPEEDEALKEALKCKERALGETRKRGSRGAGNGKGVDAPDTRVVRVKTGPVVKKEYPTASTPVEQPSASFGSRLKRKIRRILRI